VSLRAVSYGGGVQSTALLVLAARGDIDFPLFLFANVGDDSENPDSLRYLHEVAAPYAAAHGIELVELRRVLRDGTTRTLRQEIETQVRSIPIPARMGAGGFGRKKCTERFKIAVVRRELRRRGATADDPALVAIGFSTDEIERAGAGRVDERDPTRLRAYPLLELGLNRGDCRRVIDEAGLPVPPKSSCSFCPLHDVEGWRRLRRTQPERWDDAVRIDALIRERAVTLGRGAMGLVSPTVPLEDAVDDQLALFDGDGCDSGWCFT
jgi:3'-phosphoadenosine 5'-phosphosulfate sulfotransferase (PAPS reductase)/FAD synthetase